MDGTASTIYELYQYISSETPEIIEHFAATNLFRQEDLMLPEEVFEKFIDKYRLELESVFQEMLDLWDTKGHRETLGHDNVHIAYDLFEFLHLAQSGSLIASEKYMVLFGSLLHDLGRYPELLFAERSGAIDFKKGKQIQLHAALSAYIGLVFARRYHREEDDPDIRAASLAFNRRVVAAAAFHGGANEERDPVAHHVQSLDRLAGILGSREFVRNIITDGVSRGARVYPDERLSYDRSFPFFNNLPADAEQYQNATDPKTSWTNIVHYLEMPMRNMFELSTTFGMERAKAMRRESGIILTLLTGGEGSPLYEQIFAPELNPGNVYEFPKKRLPDEIWAGIQAGLTKEETETGYELHTVDELIDIMLDQQAPDVTPETRAKTHKLLGDVPDHHKGHIWGTVLYVVARRHLNQRSESELLQKAAQSGDEMVRLIASRLLKHPLFRI